MDAFKLFRVRPGTKARLAGLDPAGSAEFADKAAAEAQLQRNTARCFELQRTLWAENRRSVLVVLQGMDTSGKDGTIRHVMTGLDPSGCRVVSFKRPSEIELDHDFLWRIHAECPRRGEIGVFNRSHYEDVVVTRVHKLIDDATATERFRSILDFERHLTANGTTILKFFLHISRAEQKRRLEARLADPLKNWKFEAGDLAERAKWPEYMRAYERAISTTSTAACPWFVIPADKKWFRNLAVSAALVAALERMELKPPAPRPELRHLTVR